MNIGIPYFAASSEGLCAEVLDQNAGHQPYMWDYVEMMLPKNYARHPQPMRRLRVSKRIVSGSS